MKHLYTLHIGTENTASGAAIDVATATAAIRDIKTRAAIRFGGFSAALVHGGWYDADRGVLVEENALRLELVSDSRAAVAAFASEAGALLEQSCVMLSGPEGVEFVGSSEVAA